MSLTLPRVFWSTKFLFHVPEAQELTPQLRVPQEGI